MHSISALGQPESEDTGRAADVENGGRRGWQVSKHDLFRARKLQLPRSGRKASFLRNLLIVAGDLFGELWPWSFVHRRSTRRRGELTERCRARDKSRRPSSTR